MAIDLDGPIAKYAGWMGEKHFGNPLPYARAALQELKKQGMKIIIHTARKNTLFG